jgi:hypothetical protein
MDDMSLASLFGGGGAPADAAGSEMGMGMGESSAESPADKVAAAMEELDPKDVLQYMIDMGYVDEGTKLIMPDAAAEGEGAEGPAFEEMEAAATPVNVAGGA